MDENENNPVLLTNRPLKNEFAQVQKITITSSDFTLGRSLNSSVCIPYLPISRKHCTFKKTTDNEWYVEDNSSLGIIINNQKLGQGSKRKLKHEDLISLEPTNEFIYKFIIPSEDVFETPRKRMRMVECDTDIIDNVKLKFEESQQCEIQHIEEKIQNAKHMQSTSMTLKKQLQEDMNRRIQQLENEFSVQIENLKGEKNEVEQQKASLIEERDTQLKNVKYEMEGKIAELMEQIVKHNETESDLLKENGSLKDKLLKEREDFLSELNRETSSKQDMLDKLEAKIREQEEIRIKDRQELEDTLRKETEQLRLAKEQELQELEEQKRLREIELQQELSNIKKNLAEQVEQTEQQRAKAEQELKLQIERMKKLQEEEKDKMDQFHKEREEIQMKLTEAQIDAEKSKVEVQARVMERETELAALASERIQNQVDQSSKVISTLQEQLEKVKSQLQSVETEKNTILQSICMDPVGEGTSKEETLHEVGELMESELQCSICAELFVEATTLNCSHTFCKYCITTWKKKKKDCPNCRSPITSECKSLVLDTFIEKMVQTLNADMKTKRQEMLRFRAELEAEQARLPAARTDRGGSGFYSTSDGEYIEEEEDYDEEGYYHGEFNPFWEGRRDSAGFSTTSDADGGSDDATDSDESGRATARLASDGNAPSISAESSNPVNISSDASSDSDSGSDDAAEHSDTDRSSSDNNSRADFDESGEFKPAESSDTDRESNDGSCEAVDQSDAERPDRGSSDRESDDGSCEAVDQSDAERPDRGSSDRESDDESCEAVDQSDAERPDRGSSDRESDDGSCEAVDQSDAERPDRGSSDRESDDESCEAVDQSDAERPDRGSSDRESDDESCEAVDQSDAERPDRSSSDRESDDGTCEAVDQSDAERPDRSSSDRESDDGSCEAVDQSDAERPDRSSSDRESDDGSYEAVDQSDAERPDWRSSDIDSGWADAAGSDEHEEEAASASASSTQTELSDPVTDEGAFVDIEFDDASDQSGTDRHDRGSPVDSGCADFDETSGEAAASPEPSSGSDTDRFEEDWADREWHEGSFTPDLDNSAEPSTPAGSSDPERDSDASDSDESE